LSHVVIKKYKILNVKYYMENIKKEDLAYIAGFLDGDGSIISQIVKEDKYIYKFKIRISIVFFQKTKNKWILLWLKDILKYGYIRDRNDGMSEYTIISADPVKTLLQKLRDYIKLKKNLVNLVLKIIEDKKNIKSVEDFIEVCKLVDLTINLTYSKRRVITTEYVKEYLQNNKLLK